MSRWGSRRWSSVDTRSHVATRFTSRVTAFSGAVGARTLITRGTWPALLRIRLSGSASSGGARRRGRGGARGRGVQRIRGVRPLPRLPRLLRPPGRKQSDTAPAPRLAAAPDVPSLWAQAPATEGARERLRPNVLVAASPAPLLVRQAQ